jgi:hypothetical protein
LPLPKQLIRNVVFLPKCAKLEVVKKPATSLGDTLLFPSDALIHETVRQGLPQGSVLSPLVVRAFLGREIRAALGKQEVVRLWWVDDLTLGARSRPKLEHALEALRERLQGHPAGPILLHVDQPTSVEHGRVRVFGYILQPGRGHGDNFVHVHPHHERFDRFHRKLYDLWKAEGQPLSFEALEDFILGRLAHWMPSQQAWTIVPVFSQKLALSCAVAYVSDKEREEFKQLKFQIATAAE